MGRFFVPLDVNYQMDDKIMSAGPTAECLYVRGLAYSKRAGTEGRVHRNQLRALALGLPNKPDKWAQVLVDVGLWEQIGADYYIAGWLNHNMSNAALAEQKAMIRRKSIAGNHKRHHVAKGVTDEDCELCTLPPGTESSPSGETQGSQTRPKNLPTEEEPKTNRTEDEQNRTEENRTEENRKESSSSPSDLQPPVDKPDEAEDDLIEAAMNLVADTLAQRNSTDPFAYKRTVMRDPDRRADLQHIHNQHPGFNAEQLAALHGGRALAHVNAMTEPETATEPPPASTYVPPPPVTPAEIEYCPGCQRPAAMMRAMGCRIDPKPDHCADLATIHPLRPHGEPA